MEVGFPKPGETVQRDFRPAGQQPVHRPAIRLLQWNIERGYQLPGIIEKLRRLDADVISLQEVDVGCDRSGGADTGAEIAAALGLNYLFLCEFEELRSPLRDARSQGGGVHGNAILTKFDITDVQVVEHRLHPVDWNNPMHPLARREPRAGSRAVLQATVLTPQGPLLVYNAHLEVFCGMLARISQLSDIFADARNAVDAGFPHQAILGDLNTMAHGIARLSPNYCRDRMRYWSIGSDEAVVWERTVLSCTDPRYTGESSSSSQQPEPSLGNQQQEPKQLSAIKGKPAAAAAAQGFQSASGAAIGAAAGPGVALEEAPAAEAALAEAAVDAAPLSTVPAAALPPPPGPRVNMQLLAWGLPLEVARDAVNPGFADPFPAATTVTLDNPSYRWFGMSLMRGKLDWVLLRRLGVRDTAIGNEDYALSDHKWLMADVCLE